ncbi:WD repeat-containing protein 93-like isoform X2 [Amphiura filiformis]|uniref:WD repeat-containing protein 93-like isoform X2 n=1 Tax=Amphiura filiformis TaxID=82378 RepID=UPI003B21DEA9
MPVYVRKNLMSITPDSLSNLSSDEDDYIKDPDQLIDKLPQPFRLVDKIFNRLFDIAWEICAIREAIREEERSKIRPPLYDCAVKLDDYGKALSLCESTDGRYLLIGLPNGLAIINAANQLPVASWEQSDAGFETVKSCLIGVQVYFVATIDSNSVLRLFCCAYEGIHLIKVVNEDLPEGSKVVDVQLSHEGDYMAVTIENEADTWLDVFKLPCDTWLRELENAQANAIKEQKAAAESAVDKQEAGDDVANEDGTTGSVTKAVSSQPTTPRESPMPPVTIHDVQLSKPLLHMKIKPTPSVVTASTSVGNQLASFKTTDDGNIIGLGNRHIIQEQHLEMRRNVFKQFHEEQLRYLPKDVDKPKLRAQCLFLNPSLILPAGLETNADVPNSIAVAWTGSTNICHYNLIKPVKDIEGKPEVIWPCSSPVTALATSPCTSLLAIGQNDGTVTVWNKQQGIPLGVSHTSRHGEVNYLRFITAAPFERPVTQPYLQSPKVVVLVGSTDGQFCLIKCGYGEPVRVQHLDGPVIEEPEKFTVIEPLSTMPQVVLLVREMSEISLMDVSKKHVLCLAALPPGYQLSSPMKPIISQAGNAQMLYLRGDKTDDENQPNNAEESALFVFQLRSFPCLDGYLQKASQEHGPYVAHVTVQKRFDALLADRLIQQNSRQQRMQQRWSMLRGEIDNLPSRYRVSTPAIKA